MRIEDLDSRTVGDRRQVAATVIWEDCDRGSQRVFFETDEAHAGDLVCDPHAFLIACVIPAMRYNEQRVAIDERICPELHNGLRTIMGWYREWYGPPRRAVRIEVNSGARISASVPPRAGSFLSGGVDSLAILRANRLQFPKDHPRSIRDCLIVHGFDIGGMEEMGEEEDTFRQALVGLQEIAADAGVDLVPVRTNVRHLDDDVPFWIYEFHGAALAAVAHVFSRRLTDVSIASGFNIPNMARGATHPLIDPNYSSTNLRIRHEGILFSRLDKVRLVSDWQVALQNLRVCTRNPPGMLNCGKCEKCVRTMTQLLAVGKLDQTSVFPTNDVSVDLLDGIRITESFQDAWYGDLIAPLVAQGRSDLAEVIKAKRAEFERHVAWVEERDWKGFVKKFDRRHLGGKVFALYKWWLEWRRHGR